MPACDISSYYYTMKTLDAVCKNRLYFIGKYATHPTLKMSHSGQSHHITSERLYNKDDEHRLYNVLAWCGQNVNMWGRMQQFTLWYILIEILYPLACLWENRYSIKIIYFVLHEEKISNIFHGVINLMTLTN